jgi:hypothetical protein
MPTKNKSKNRKAEAKTRNTAAQRKGATKNIPKKKTVKRKASLGKTIAARDKKNARKRPEIVGLDALEPKTARGRAGRQAGDLQGLSRIESADSESVAELLEEGNTFEAEAVAGVEAADVDEREVQTHEVPEDDVPDEYLHKD